MGKFVVRGTKAGFRFSLLATNGQVIAVSERYSTEAACLNGIESVRRSCMGPVEDQTVENYEVLPHPKYEVYQDKSGQYRFRLKAVNGQIVATGESYQQLPGCLNGVESIKRNAPDAQVVREDSLPKD